MSKKKIYTDVELPSIKTYNRGFLNLEEGSAFYELDSKLEETFESSEYIDYDCHLKVADCNRVITLDFSVDLNYGSILDITNAKFKARQLGKAINQILEELDEVEKVMLQGEEVKSE